MKQNPTARKEQIVVQQIDSETLIYDLKIDKAFCLNETSSMIWNELDGIHSISEISNLLSQKLRVSISEDIINLAISQFKKDGLLENGSEFQTPFDGLSRREIVKKIGFASMVALPIIASVVAPTAVNAQSGNCITGICQPSGLQIRNLDGGCPCSNPLDCCSNTCLSSGSVCVEGVLGGAASSCVSIGMACPPLGTPQQLPGCRCASPSQCASCNCASGGLCSRI